MPELFNNNLFNSDEENKPDTPQEEQKQENTIEESKNRAENDIEKKPDVDAEPIEETDKGTQDKKSDEEYEDWISDPAVWKEPITQDTPVNGTYNYQWNDEAYRRAVQAKPKRSKVLVALTVTVSVLFILGIVAAGIMGIISLKNKAGGDNSSNAALVQNSTPANNNTAQTGDKLSIPQIVNKVSPAVVAVIAGDSAVGSGIIMSADGFILTNAHVVEGSKSFKVVDNNGKEYDAALIGSDTTADLAVLKIDATGLPKAEFGDSSKSIVGETVVAIGNPYGLELANTVTSGIISAIRKNIDLGGRAVTLIQTDASINPGNSGGPLINEYGQVIGITSLKIMNASEGLGFAIPINTAKPIIDSLILYGYVKRPMLGITGIMLVQADAEKFGLPAGFQVQVVDAGSDAAEKGLKQYDIITKINGKTFISLDEFNVEKEKFKAGDTVRITYFRAGKYYDIDVKLIESKPLAG